MNLSRVGLAHLLLHDRFQPARDFLALLGFHVRQRDKLRQRIDMRLHDVCIDITAGAHAFDIFDQRIRRSIERVIADLERDFLGVLRAVIHRAHLLAAAGIEIGRQRRDARDALGDGSESAR